jgi:hypothetical protein
MIYDPPNNIQKFCRDRLRARIDTINSQTDRQTMIDIGMSISLAQSRGEITDPQARGLRVSHQRAVKAAIKAKEIRDARYGATES